MQLKTSQVFSPRYYGYIDNNGRASWYKSPVQIAYGNGITQEDFAELGPDRSYGTRQYWCIPLDKRCPLGFEEDDIPMLDITVPLEV